MTLGDKCQTPALYYDTGCEGRILLGHIPLLQEGQDVAGKSTNPPAPMPTVNPNTQGMKWMKEHQHSYDDAQLDFWLLLRPLTDGSEESTRHLARRLLSMWHWSSAMSTLPPTPLHAYINEHRILAIRKVTSFG